MGEIKIGDKALVEMNVVGWDKITGDYQMIPKEDTRTFWASKETVYPVPTKTYEDGLREAWELARKIAVDKSDGGLSREEMGQIFESYYMSDAFDNYTPQEAAAKIAEWEEKHRIHIGDILRDNVSKNGEAVVSRVDADRIYVVWPDGSCGECEAKNFTKTGRTIDIAGLLAQIGGTEDE